MEATRTPEQTVQDWATRRATSARTRRAAAVAKLQQDVDGDLTFSWSTLDTIAEVEGELKVWAMFSREVDYVMEHNPSELLEVLGHIHDSAVESLVEQRFNRRSSSESANMLEAAEGKATSRFVRELRGMIKHVTSKAVA